MRRLLPPAWAVLLFAFALALFTHANRFPFFYHPDEPDKVEQALTGEWKFEHPMLLVLTARWAVTLLDISEPQQTVIAGRWLSASFAALAVAALSLLAWLRGGWPGAIIAGLMLALHHQLFELAHYMKEDTAMLLGVGVTFLAIGLYERRPGPLTASLLGLGCALAASGKYIGILLLAAALPILCRRPRAAHLALFAATALAAFAVLNHPLLLDLAHFRQSLEKESTLVVGGQGGMTRSVPHWDYWSVFNDNSGPTLWLFLLCYLWFFWKTRPQRTLGDWITLAWPIAYAVLLSFSPKTNDRYFLPATALLTLLAALGAVEAATRLPRRIPPRTALALCGAIAVLGQLPGLIRYWRAFSTDDRAALVTAIRAQLPPDAVIAQDRRVMLPHPDSRHESDTRPPLPQRIVSLKRDLTDRPLLEDLRAEGVTHVVISQSDYGRYFRDSLRSQEKSATENNRRREFYETILASGPPLFDRPYTTVIYLHPGLKLYPLPHE